MALRIVEKFHFVIIIAPLLNTKVPNLYRTGFETGSLLQNFMFALSKINRSIIEHLLLKLNVQALLIEWGKLMDKKKVVEGFLIRQMMIFREFVCLRIQQ